MAREQDHRKHAADKAAVERHPSLPHLEAFQRIFGEIGRVVEKDVADAAAQNDAQRDPENEIVVVCAGSSGPGPPRRAPPA